MPLCQEQIFLAMPDSQSYWCCAGSHRQEFFGYASACGCASHIYGCCYPYGLDPRVFFHRSSFYQYRDRYLCDPAPGILSFRNVSGCGSLPRVLCNAFPVVYLQAPGGYNSSTIFSTNNLRQFTTAVTQFLMKKDSAQCDKAKFYGMTLLSFHTGAALSLILYMTCGLSGVWLCLVPAFYAVWLISADRNTAADTPAVTRSTASDGSSFRNLSYKKKEA